jgi:ethanolamine ammonia-lyase small subunit
MKRNRPPSPGRRLRQTADNARWADLRRLTAARIGLKRTGASLATGPLLEFQLAHARARDAVHEPFDAARLAADFAAAFTTALAELSAPVLSVASAAPDRHHYLMRPDLGRQLAPGAKAMLAPHAGHYDIVLVVADGLSARAVTTHAQPVLAQALPALRADGWRIAPLVIVCQGRVAIGDAIAGALGADGVVVLIGERPGLTAPDSMGAYLTWQPRPHTTDADRNCISNIRPQGIGYADAAFKLVHLLRTMRARGLSGVALKDDSDRLWLGDSSLSDS